MTLWQQFYNNIRDPAWPDCVTEHEFDQLSDAIQQEILHVHHGKSYVCPDHSDFEFIQPGQHLQKAGLDNNAPSECNLKFPVASDFDVHHSADQIGAWSHASQNYSRVLKYLYPNKTFDHCLDWCAGPGPIGFRLLSDGICRNLTLQEIHAPALHAAEQTWQNRPDRLKSAHLHMACTDTIESMPLHSKFDLVVGNPPNGDNAWFDSDNPTMIRVGRDVGWRIHQEFFANIAARLHTQGRIVLAKRIETGSADTFLPWITKGGLRVARVFRERKALERYYIELQHQ